MAQIHVPILVNWDDIKDYMAKSDIVEVVRCKDCKFYEIAWLKKDGTDDNRYKPSICVNAQYGITRKPDWFCADAERKEE